MQNPNETDPMPDEDPIPLTHAVQIPAFPTDALPTRIADMVNTISEATQTDPAMAGTCSSRAILPPPTMAIATVIKIPASAPLAWPS